MRYYSITITPTFADATNVTAPIAKWTSFVNGVNDPGALDVEFDFFASNFAQPMSASTIIIHGIALADLFEAQQYAGLYVTVAAGMQKGLPLANPAQAGIILQGQIFQSFGNWTGTDMTLWFVVYSGSYTVTSPGNIVLNWPAGSSLESALATCLRTAYPNAQQSILISDQYYVLSHQTLAYYANLPQLAQYIKSRTQAVRPPGVDISKPKETIIITDGSKPTPAKQISFTDLIGQPTWVDVNLMTFTTPMRADIEMSSFVQMPPGLQSAPGLVQTQPVEGAQLRYKTAFQGTFQITAVRHIGNFRDPNGSSWATVFQCVPTNLGTNINLITGTTAGGV